MIKRTQTKTGVLQKVGVYLVLIGLVLLTRIPCLTHEMNNHPDEPVFVHGSASVADQLLDDKSVYTEAKPYPEGAYFFYAPFQLIAKVLGIDEAGRLTNRIGSLFYFVFGCVAGLCIMRRFFHPKTAVIYILLVVFSQFFIEQSRYGTGESISFALLMLIVLLTALWIEAGGGRTYCIYLAFVLVGFLTAVKYPQLYFVLIPVCAVVQRERKRRAHCVFLILTGLVLTLVGALLLSPMIIRDVRYLQEVVERELRSYIYNGNRTELGGFANHVFYTLAYWLLYASVLFAPVLFVSGIVKLRPGAQGQPACSRQETATFFKWLLPAVALGFLTYNLFTTTLFMRTLCPFFALSLPYMANGLYQLQKQKRWLYVCLMSILVLHGSLLIGAMIPYSARDHLDDCVAQAVEKNGEQRIVGLGIDIFITGWGQTEMKVDVTDDYRILDLLRDGFPEFHSGDVVITGSFEYGQSAPYLFPIRSERVARIIGEWRDFKERYRDGYVGQAYPQYYGSLFGLWIKGTTLSDYDFPMNYVYAIP